MNHFNLFFTAQLFLSLELVENRPKAIHLNTRCKGITMAVVGMRGLITDRAEGDVIQTGRLGRPYDLKERFETGGSVGLLQIRLPGSPGKRSYKMMLYRVIVLNN